jgi:hypothetical protein
MNIADRTLQCDSQQPCLNCVRRGVANLCHPIVGDSQEPKVSTKRQKVTTDELGPFGGPSVSLDDDAISLPDESAPRVGKLFKSRGAPTFYGASYFGPQVAATMIEANAPDYGFDVYSQRSAATQSFRHEGGPFTELWDLLGILPRQKSTVDRLTDKFLTHVDWSIDAVHAATFRAKYAKFWERKCGFDDIGTVDLRWLALLFIILAFGELLDCPQPCSPERQRDCESSSYRLYWACRRAIVIAPSFYGESVDLVRAGILVTRYLIHTKRLSESWLTISFASRFAIAQGMHVDGTRWNLPRASTETRRRLWSHLYTLDRMISLALGRPYAISDHHCLTREASNIWVDDMTTFEARSAKAKSMDEPTPSLLSIFNYRLAKIIGRIQESCFGLDPPLYDKVLNLDRELVDWKDGLPSYFRFENTDFSLDGIHKFLKWHRLSLHTNFHFARITLHRPYLLRTSIINRFQHSWDACIDSACTDLRVRLGIHTTELIEVMKWSLGAHQLFNSALVLGIIAIRTPNYQQSRAILEDLEAYCDKQNTGLWVNEFELAEIKVVQLCIAHARKRPQGSGSADVQRPNFQQSLFETQQVSYASSLCSTEEPQSSSMAIDPTSPPTPLTPDRPEDQPFLSDPFQLWPDSYFGFPDAGDLHVWQQMIRSMETDC